MELVVRKNDLLRELQLFQGIVERKNTIPILANVLIEAKGDEVRMLATDLEVALRSRCQASVAKSGSLTLPAKKLYEIIKALPETDVRIEEDKGGVKVAADRFDYLPSPHNFWSHEHAYHSPACHPCPGARERAARRS